MNVPRIAIISPNRNAWSETFIAAHIARLQRVELVLTDGHLPKRDADGEPLLRPSFAQRAIARITGKQVDDLLRERIAGLLRAHRIDLVLAEYGPTGEAMLDVCERLRIPIVVHFHGVDAWHAKLLREQERYGRIFQKAAAIIAVSREMERQLLALGAPRERLHYNCYGIDVERFRSATPHLSPPRFIAVGRFADTKAPYLTLLAFHRAWQQRGDLRLTMIGTGPLRETCGQLVQALGIAEAVDLPGVLAHEQVAAAMQAARAFVQHSVITSEDDREGTPLAILEAMASGLPVIATRHAGIVDVIDHGVEGLLCDERDITAMSADMLAVAADPSLAKRLGGSGRARILREHRMEQSIDALQVILLRAAAHQRSSGTG